MELIVAMIYGQGLFDAARELDKIDEIKEEIEEIKKIFDKEEDYFRLLCNPAIPNIKKKELIRNIFKGRISDEVLHFLYILSDKDRMLHYDKIVNEYERLVGEYRGLGEGIIYSVVPLNREQLEKFETEAGNLLKKKVKLKNEIDESLIGGVKLLVDGKLIDASLRGRLNELSERVRKI